MKSYHNLILFFFLSTGTNGKFLVYYITGLWAFHNVNKKIYKLWKLFCAWLSEIVCNVGKTFAAPEFLIKFQWMHFCEIHLMETRKFIFGIKLRFKFVLTDKLLTLSSKPFASFGEGSASHIRISNTVNIICKHISHHGTRKLNFKMFAHCLTPLKRSILVQKSINQNEFRNIRAMWRNLLKFLAVVDFLDECLYVCESFFSRITDTFH